MRKDEKTVLITGTSSGIGRATALASAEAGYITYATARRPNSIMDLQEQGLQTLTLDVTKEQTMRAAVQSIEQRHGSVDILINNAGYSEMGPVEEADMEKVHKQFETNVFGLIRLSQLVLPGMRKNDYGQIINVSSMGGEFTTPFSGIYNASKHAVESISDALRFEVQSFGIRVIVIQPGVVQTRSATTVTRDLKIEEESPYFNQLNAFKGFLEENASEENASTIFPEDVANVIIEASKKPDAATRYKVGEEAEQLANMRQDLSDHEWDNLFRQQLGLYI
jgi:NADP-dependent 3-hydroxy acid dehydrogenase YdfG